MKEGALPSEPRRYKVSLVAKGFTQKEDVDFTDVFSLVVNYKIIKMMLALISQFNWEVE